jgi:hypothetical protein
VTEEEKDALTKGNSDEMIRVNKEKFDYSGVPKKDLLPPSIFSPARAVN